VAGGGSADGAVDLGWAVVTRELLEQLPERQRRVIVLRHVHHLPLREIARREGVAPETVRDALGRAHARLRRLLGRT
jgi:RNA polymerase sigma factor (sigma-70 family)